MADVSRSTSPQAAPLSAQGVCSAVGAFVIWGLFPIYLFGLTSVSALQITSHRVAWSFLFILLWMGLRGELGQIRDAARRRGVLVRLAASAILVSINWLAFVWGVNQDRVVEVSLGYFINPLVNVLLGILVLSERLNRMQWGAVALAAFGVAYITFDAGHLPWIALTLACSFGLYGLIRKTASVEALPGLAIEMTMLAPLAVGYLIWCELAGFATFTHSGARIDLLLVLSGIVTALPLYLFSLGARRIPYSTVGVLQYIAPSLQLVCAMLVFGEPFELDRLIGFAFIWAALLVYAADGLWRARTVAPKLPPSSEQPLARNT
jgi:chloramphenicol-sensitive protein RarD